MNRTLLPSLLLALTTCGVVLNPSRLAAQAAPVPSNAGAPAGFQYAQATVVLFNENQPESKALAFYYAKKRGIPGGNLLGLKTSASETISRDEYQKTIEGPLRAAFLERGYWKTGVVEGMGTIAVQTRIRVMAIMRGVPLRISEDPVYSDQVDPKTGKKTVIAPVAGKANAASVDSELAIAGALDRELDGPVNNNYFDKNVPFYTLPITPMFLIGRIDGPDDATARRLIDDALATEAAGGLQGKVYADLALKNDAGYKEGEEWILAAAGRCERAGFPVIVDSLATTFPVFYPMEDAALYYGWYTGKADGPFLNPVMKFRQGAVACHIHSYSATTIRTTTAQWCGPLLAKGACGVLGNVWEPYLSLCVHLDKFNEALLSGRNLAEAAWGSTVGLSWMNVVLGDPLYTPFPQNAVDPDKKKDADYKALRVALQRWGGDAEKDTLMKNLEKAAGALKSGTIYEYMALHAQAGERDPDEPSAKWFAAAEKTYREPEDKIRVRMERADSLRRAGKGREALKVLTSIKEDWPKEVSAAAAEAWAAPLRAPQK